MGATPTGATPTGPTLDPLNILVNKFNIATHVALILFLFSSWINYLLYDTKSVMVFWQLLSKIKRFVTIFRISWNGPTLFNIPIGDFPPNAFQEHPSLSSQVYYKCYTLRKLIYHDQCLLSSFMYIVAHLLVLWINAMPTYLPLQLKFETPNASGIGATPIFFPLRLKFET